MTKNYTKWYEEEIATYFQVNNTPVMIEGFIANDGQKGFITFMIDNISEEGKDFTNELIDELKPYIINYCQDEYGDNFCEIEFNVFATVCEDDKHYKYLSGDIIDFLASKFTEGFLDQGKEFYLN